MAAMSYLAALAQRTVGADPAIRPLLPAAYQSAMRGGAMHGGATRSGATRSGVTPGGVTSGGDDAGVTAVASHVAAQGVASDFDGLAVEEAGGRSAGGRNTSVRGTPPLPAPAAAARGAAQAVPRTALQAATHPDRFLPARMEATTVREVEAASPAEVVRPDSVRIAMRPRDVRPAPETSPTARSTAPRTRDQVRALASEPAAPQEPTIQVRIGRIDVRAAPASGPAAMHGAAMVGASSRPAAKRTSLADYLSAEGRRGDSGGQP